MDNNKIGKFISRKRKQKGLTQQELGNKLFVSDKAVSKWERGLSLPDISIIGKLADELETDIYSILQIKKDTHISIEEKLKEERKMIKHQILKKELMFFSPIILVILIVLFKLIPFGYDVVHVRYQKNDNKLINIGVPKFSFFMKSSGNNYSYKNLRGKNILKSELKNYTNSLKHISCNDTTYYYDQYQDVTIIDYMVTGNLFYNTISYNFRDGNYCDAIMVKEYNEKLGSLNTFHRLYTEESSLMVNFLPSLQSIDNKYDFSASLDVYYNDNSINKIIEVSSGTFKIDGNKLIYYREKIDTDGSVKIPNKSVFIIKDKKLILEDNYLKDYEKSIVLK